MAIYRSGLQFEPVVRSYVLNLIKRERLMDPSYLVSAHILATLDAWDRRDAAGDVI